MQERFAVEEIGYYISSSDVSLKNCLKLRENIGKLKVCTGC